MNREEFEKIEKDYNWLRKYLTPLAMTWHPQFHDTDRIPKEGAVVLCGNHRTNADPPFMALSTDRVVHFLAKKELHEGPFRWLFKKAGTIVVDRSRHHNGSLEKAKEVLELGGVIGIYPEGTRNKTDMPIQPLKFGAVKMAQKTGAWIVPLITTGTGLPFVSRVQVYVGEPYKIAPDADLTEENEKLRQILTEMYLQHTSGK